MQCGQRRFTATTQRSRSSGAPAAASWTKSASRHLGMVNARVWSRHQAMPRATSAPTASSIPSALRRSEQGLASPASLT